MRKFGPRLPGEVGVLIMLVSTMPAFAFPPADALRRAVAPPPLLVETRAQATLGPDGLAGTISWRVRAHWPNQTLTLRPLGIALLNPDPPFQAGAGVLLAGAGDQTVTADFSLRSVPEPGAEVFNLNLPAAPVARLDLNLPDGTVPEMAAALVTGPTPGEPGRQNWQVAFSGAPGGVLTLRRSQGELPAMARFDQATRIVFTPGLATLTSTLTLTPIRGSVQELTLTLDPRVRLTSLTGPGQLTWRVLPEGPVVVTSQGRGITQLTLVGLADFPDAPEAWACPVLGGSPTVPGAETLEISCGPDLKWLGLDPGGYRVTAAQAISLFGVDRGYEVSLTRSGSRPAAPVRVRATLAGPEFTTVDELTAEIGAEVRLTARVRGTVTRGPVERVVVQGPAGFGLAGVRWLPDDPDLGVATAPDGTLTLTPSRAVSAGQTFEAQLDLRGPPVPAQGMVSVPTLRLPEATAREGTLSVRAAMGWTLTPAPGRTPFRGAAPVLAVTATLLATPLGADIETELIAGPTGWSAVSSVQLRGAAGRSVLVTVADPDAQLSRDQPNGVARPLRDLLALGQKFAGPLQLTEAALPAAWLLDSPASGAESTWRITTTGRTTEQGLTRLPVPRVGGVATRPRVRESAITEGLTLDLQPDFVGVSARPTGAGTGWLVSDAHRLVEVRPQHLEITLTGTVQDRPPGAVRLPVTLPDGGTFLAAFTEGRLIPRPDVRGRLVTVPVPAGAAVPVEIRYRLPAPPGWPLRQIPPPTDGLPSEAMVATTAKLDPTLTRWPSLTSTPAPFPATGLMLVPATVPRGAGWALAILILGGGLILPGRLAGPLLAILTGLAGVVRLVSPDGWAVVAGPVVAAGLFTLLVRLTLFRVAVDSTEPSDSGSLPSTMSVVRSLSLLSLMLLAPGTQAQDATTSPELTAADYTLDATGGGTARVQAEWQLSATANAGRVRLPLSGVRLEAVAVDGAAVAVAVVPPDGYSIPVRAAARRVTAQFLVPVRVAGADQEARFGVPALADCRVRASAPAGAAGVDVPTRRGVQRSQPGGRLTVVADHGAGETVAVRWRGGEGPPLVAITDMTVWDVTEAGISGQAALGVRADGGITGAALDIPPGVEPGLPTITGPDGRETLGLPTVAAARLEPGPNDHRTLTITFRDPAAGRFVILVPLTQAAPRTGALTLPLIRILTPNPAEAFLAVRAGGRIGETERRQLIDFPTDEAVRRFATFPELNLMNRPPDRVFQALPGDGAELRTTLRPLTLSTTLTGEAIWTVGRTADLDAVLTSIRPEASGVLELDWPASLTITDLRADGLLFWSQSENQVAIWLRRPTREITLRLTGRILLAEALDTPQELPLIPGLDGTASSRVRAATGWQVTPTRTEQRLVVTREAASPEIVPVEPPSISRPKTTTPKPAPPADPTPKPAPPAPPSSAPPTPWLQATFFALGLGLFTGLASRLGRPERLVLGGGLGWGLAGLPVFGLLIVVGLTWRIVGRLMHEPLH